MPYLKVLTRPSTRWAAVSKQAAWALAHLRSQGLISPPLSCLPPSLFFRSAKTNWLSCVPPFWSPAALREHGLDQCSGCTYAVLCQQHVPWWSF